ncbi:MAG: hypothetical protein EOO09_04450 [Chitinophagaceae bacterium]|nr:MAG: hypothetical protein EOO09_04450 [Chitinophagaceae bacterium]
MQTDAYTFLDAKGEMAGLIRNFDWDSTSIGNPAGWPQLLKTSVSILLRSGFPMFICWGPELLSFYNDGYRQSLIADGRHPGILGTPVKRAWSEILDYIGPLLDEVSVTGNTIWKENQAVPILRGGETETTYWTFSYGPLTDGLGMIRGLLVTCMETTDKVKAFKELEESHLNLGFAIEAAELGTFDYNPRTDVFIANPRLRDWFGLPGSGEMKLPQALASIVDHESKQVADAIRAAFDPDSGGKYVIEYSLKTVGAYAERRVLAKGRVFFDSEKKVMRMSGILQDITALRQAENEKQESQIREQQIIARETLKAQEAERNQLATELHDNICQILAAVKIQLSFFNKDNVKNISIIHNCMDHIDEALIETRDISHRMVIPRFTDTSLSAALANLATIYNNDHRLIVVTQDGDSITRMPVSHKEALYRIAQEQFNNIEKYAKATEVHVTMSLGEESVKLLIEDNGVGFDTATTTSGIGLHNIHNRAAMLNGSAEIISAPGHGCSLLVMIPLED